MQVLTYEIEEINGSEASALAADGEAMDLIEKLGLEGQKSLLSKDSNGTRFPYPVMTQLEALVYSTCFPQKTSLRQFSHEIIPVRVLQVAAFCKDFNQTQWLEVWHPQVSKTDPVLVGRKSEYSGDNYLLARWGTALLPFEELLEQAKQKYAILAKQKLASLKAQLSTLEVSLESSVASAFITGNEPSFSLYA